jgi:hypothetical protein
MEDSKVSARLLSPEASMILALWDGTHGDNEESFELAYSRPWWGQEDIRLHDYEQTWCDIHPSRRDGRSAIPLFQLAAELVASRLFAPGTYNALSASWERSETTWDVALGKVESDDEDSFPDSEWVETLAGWEEIPIARWRQVTPGGMAAYRLLFAFGDGSFAGPPGLVDGRYVPFRWANDDCPEVSFRFAGGRHENISGAFIGGSDYGPRSAWIKHLVGEVELFHFRISPTETSPILLYSAHLELLEQLERSIGQWGDSGWGLGPRYTPGDPMDDPF